MHPQCKKCKAYYHSSKLEKGMCELCHDDHVEKIQWWKVKAGTALACVVLITLVCTAAYYRVPAMWDCQMRQWEENRETEFTIFRGRCLYVLPDGRRIPITQSRHQTSDTETEETE